jgi:acetyl-CoA carboxylase carboxyl transferase subunit beta
MLNKSMFIKPKISLEGEPKDAGVSPAEMMMKPCPRCETAFFISELEESLYVCPECGFHFRIDARKRIALLADEGSFIEQNADLQPYNRLSFREYDEKLEKALRSGEKEAVVTGTCRFSDIPAALFVMNPSFMMGSMGTVVGEKIARLFEFAAQERLPVVGFTVSGGARVQEGMFSLMQMAKTSGAVLKHSQAGLFYLTILTDPTTGGVTASFAMEGDIILSEPEALIGFAGPRVIEQTMRTTLPEGFQRAEFLLEKGFVDKIVDRRSAKETIAMLLRMHDRGETP